VLAAAIGYAVVGVVTAGLSAGDATVHGKATWRLVAWVLSLAIFAIALSLVAWPSLTGLPAFIAALLGGYIIERARKST
jgi:hypothetical protein